MEREKNKTEWTWKAKLSIAELSEFWAIESGKAMWVFGRLPNLSFVSERVERWHTVSENNAFTEASRGGLQGPIPDFRPGFSLGWKASTSAAVCSLPSARTMYGCSVVVCHLYGLFREQYQIVLAFVTTSFCFPPPPPPTPPTQSLNTRNYYVYDFWCCCFASMLLLNLAWILFIYLFIVLCHFHFCRWKLCLPVADLMSETTLVSLASKRFAL